jgi:antitoxin component YwqK of YwqJK toxin-antitoxin module
MKHQVIIFFFLPLLTYGQKLTKVEQFYKDGTRYATGFKTSIKGFEEPYGLWTYWYPTGQKQLEIKYTRSAKQYLNYWTPDSIQILKDGYGVYIEVGYDNDHPWRGYKDSTIYTIKNFVKKGKFTTYRTINGIYHKYIIGTYTNNIRHRSDTTFHPNGNIHSATSCENNQCFVRLYYYNGNLEREGLMVNYVEEGEWKLYTDSGQLLNRINYSKGKLKGKFYEYFKSGKLKETGDYVAVKKSNPRYQDGKQLAGIKEEKYLFESVKDGVWTYYTDQEVLQKTEVYENGKLISIKSN